MTRPKGKTKQSVKRRRAYFEQPAPEERLGFWAKVWRWVESLIARG